MNYEDLKAENYSKKNTEVIRVFFFCKIML